MVRGVIADSKFRPGVRNVLQGLRLLEIARQVLPRMLLQRLFDDFCANALDGCVLFHILGFLSFDDKPPHGLRRLVFV